MRNMRNILCFFLLCCITFSVPGVLAGDATSFDPTRYPVKPTSSGGVPVGTIVAWPVSKNPQDMDKWLECNGQTISAAVYPELVALVGAKVPDYRGLFLRGVGGNSAGLGVTQGDAIRNIMGNTGHGAVEEDPGRNPNAISGAFYYAGLAPAGGIGEGQDWILGFDASRVVPTANENRPVNMAVRYLIRARP